MINAKIHKISKFFSDLKLNQITIRKDDIVFMFKEDNKRVDSIDFLELKYSTKRFNYCIQMTHVHRTNLPTQNSFSIFSEDSQFTNPTNSC